MRTLIPTIALALAATGLTAPAQASPDPGSAVVTRQVEYADLNLATPAGVKALCNRVGEATRELCGEAVGSDNGSAEFKFGMMRCEARGMREARPQIARLVDVPSGTIGSAPISGAIRIAVSPAK